MAGTARLKRLNRSPQPTADPANLSRGSLAILDRRLPSVSIQNTREGSADERQASPPGQPDRKVRRASSQNGQPVILRNEQPHTGDQENEAADCGKGLVAAAHRQPQLALTAAAQPVQEAAAASRAMSVTERRPRKQPQSAKRHCAGRATDSLPPPPPGHHRSPHGKRSQRQPHHPRHPGAGQAPPTRPLPPRCTPPGLLAPHASTHHPATCTAGPRQRHHRRHRAVFFPYAAPPCERREGACHAARRRRHLCGRPGSPHPAAARRAAARRHRFRPAPRTAGRPCRLAGQRRLARQLRQAAQASGRQAESEEEAEPDSRRQPPSPGPTWARRATGGSCSPTHAATSDCTRAASHAAGSCWHRAASVG